MRILLLLALAVLLPLIISCSNCKDTTKTGESENIQTQTPPTSIMQNLSLVTARVENIIFKSEADYQIQATVLVVEQRNDDKSIATPGQEYLLTPNFRYDNGKLIDSDINETLKKLGKLSKGKEFKAEISLENQKGWFIQKVLSLD